MEVNKDYKQFNTTVWQSDMKVKWTISFITFYLKLMHCMLNSNFDLFYV